MLEFIIVIVFCWIFFKAVGLAFRVAWGVAKLIASLLFIVAVPMLIGCLLFVGGLSLLAPIILAGIGLGLLKTCI